jgi:hypothetical protein
MVQEATVDMSTQQLGEIAAVVNAGNALHPQVEFVLRKFGISPEEFAVMSKFGDGERLTPDMLPDEMQASANKLRQYLNDTMNEGVLMPTVSEEALLSMGLKSGTHHGEAVRTIMQYKTFPFALMRKTYRRVLNTIGENAGESWSRRFFNRSSVEGYAFLVSMLAMGWLSFNVKEMLKGHEPVTFLDDDQRNAANLFRIMRTSGILGITGDILGSSGGGAAQFLGPVPGQVIETLAADSLYGFANEATNLIPGATFPFINEAKRSMLATMLGEAAEIQERGRERMYEAKFGQTVLFKQ